ncbi:dTDP-4-dehydrorhamnose 3,5-epimerase [Algibacter sp. 2305UL17-15]|uniref:dTDP-4-dehydrorhamnose 3,5-epimerase n=1 Tax=Algibacter sp. 2305UL17-15 TaxID=3231268 RepID=UPI003458F024
MEIENTSLNGCFIINSKVFKDNRGSFFETFNRDIFKKVTGITTDFVQDNQSTSKKGVLRGLHFQKGDYAQAKLIRVVKGKVLDVCVDLRPNSPSFGKHFKVILDAIENKQIYVPRGFAHGFLTLEEQTTLTYKCDNYYNKASEGGIIFNDDTLNIDWEFPFEKMILSDKDMVLPTFQSILK